MSSATVTMPVASSSEQSSVFTSVSSFVSSFFPVAHTEEESSDNDDDKSEEGDKEDGEEAEEGGEDEEEEEEEEDEPEDPAPAIYEECEKSKTCAPLKHHFDDCQKRVADGKGFENENCIEEFFHLAHCAQECTAPKLFAKLV